MNPGLGTPDGQGSLGSWHPAHMPNSENALGSDNHHPHQVEEKSFLSTDSKVTAAAATQSKTPSPKHPEEVSASLQPSRNETSEHPGASPRTYSSNSHDHVGTQWDNSAAGEDAHERSAPSVLASQEEQDTSIANGLSFVNHMHPTSINPDSSKSAKVDVAHEVPTDAHIFDQLAGTPPGEGLLQDFGTLHRTNSFPAIPPLHHAREDQHNLRAQSQVERIMEEEEDNGERTQTSLSASHQTNGADSTGENFFGDSTDDGGDEFPNYSIGAGGGNHSFSPADDEARFEEGLPLVPPESSTQDENAPAEPEVLSKPPGSSQEAIDQDFFGEAPDYPEEASFFKPKALDRKTTNQVLGSMNFPPHRANHEESISQADRPRLANGSAGGIASSSSTVVSQFTAEHSQITEKLPAGATEQGGEDLAAMWQAALDDDDLLDEDGESPTTQSEPLATSQPTVDHQTSAGSRLQPVYGADGRMLGHGKASPANISSSGTARDRYSPAPSQQSPASAFYPGQTSNAALPPQVAMNHNLGYSSSMPAGFGRTSVQQPLQNNVFAPPRPSMPKPTQSFADKSKGGYTSPYDLPMDVSRLKKRANLQQVQHISSPQQSSQPPPPPRSSSMYATSPSSEGPTPPVPPISSTRSPLPDGRPASSTMKEKPSVGSFFEELPITKSRPPSSAGRHAPGVLPQLSNQLPPRPEPPRQMSQLQQQAPPPNLPNATPSYQLVPPERHSPYANIPQQGSTNATPAQVNSRYSPASGSHSQVPPQRNRYTASPNTLPRPPTSTQAMPFQPRTSSPLAQHSMNPHQQHRQSSLPNDLPILSHSPLKGATSQNHAAPNHMSILPQVAEHFDPSVGRNIPEVSAEQVSTDVQRSQGVPHHHPLLDNDTFRNSASTSAIPTFAPESEPSSTSADTRSKYPVHSQSGPNHYTDHAPPGPPRRSQTQSPGAARPRPEALNRTKDTYQRPVSASDRLSPVRTEPPAPFPYATSKRNTNTSAQNVNYMPPVDGREHDLLARWKGSPILTFGFGGMVVTSFPKHIPLYTAGRGFPMIKCNPGEVKVQTSNIGTLDEDIARFPGPLKSRGRKKEIVEWLQKKVDGLEKVQESLISSSSLPDPIRKHEEKILLWKIVKILVEHDGTIAGNLKAEQSVRAILCPDMAGSEVADASSAVTGGLPGIPRHDGSHAAHIQADPNAMEAVRKLLLQGEREKAVWYAVDQRMWAHAMVLASTLDKSVWKQVLHEFTRLEVKTHGEKTESLAAIYEVFASNWDESIDQLVPPSARAGLQMVSKAASAGPTRNALDGLDRWRETLALILSNRTPDDENALIALSGLLSGYGRIEASHLCLVFAKSTGILGGSEDAQARVVLLGADHQQQPFDYGRELDSILLTEVHEFVRSVLAPSASLSVSPHLQSYKLYHAILLAEHGYRSEAQQYCDAIMSTLKSTTKPSPYYHRLLFNALDDLVERLQQAPRDASSWMSKPMDKVSGSMWKKFNNFIAGDESDTASVVSGRGDPDAGPFARVATDTPSISRSGSTADLYGAFSSQTTPPHPAPTTFGSRYAPSNQYAPTGQPTPRPSLEQQGRPSEELQRPGQPTMLRPSQPSHTYSAHQSRYTASPAPQQQPSASQQKPRYQPSPHISPRPDSYLPTPPSQPEYIPVAPPDDPSASLYSQEPHQYTAPPDPQAPQDPALSLDNPPGIGYEPPSSIYEPNASAYEPPSSYAPYSPETQDVQSPTDQPSPKKKKSFMDDDDDDFAARAAAILKNDKARKDKEADDAFRNAAEADGIRFPSCCLP